MVQTQDGGVAYTRNGSFGIAIGSEGMTLATTDGNPVLDTNGNPIVIEDTYNPADITVDETGQLLYPNGNSSDEEGQNEEGQNEEGLNEPIGITIGLAQFNNPAGLEKISGSLLKETEASGEARLEDTDSLLTKSKLKQRFLEGSNVQAVDEIVNLIVAQRAYEMNSKVISAADEMLQQANNLR